MNVSGIDRLAVFPYLVDYAIVLGAAVVLFAVVGLVFHNTSKGEPWRHAFLHVLLPIAALGTTGLTIGILVGNSLSPLGNVALSSFLTIYGGLVVFLITKDATGGWVRMAAAGGLVAAAAAMVYGASVGSAYRYQFQLREAGVEQQREQIDERFEAQLEIWKFSEQKRIERGLAADAPIP